MPFSLYDILSYINSNMVGLMDLEELQKFLLMFAGYVILFSQNPQTLQSMLNDTALL